MPICLGGKLGGFLGEKISGKVDPFIVNNCRMLEQEFAIRAGICNGTFSIYPICYGLITVLYSEDHLNVPIKINIDEKGQKLHHVLKNLLGPRFKGVLV